MTDVSKETNPSKKTGGSKKASLSKKQEEILNHIISSTAKNGYPPSVRELCSAVNLQSTSTVHLHLKRLEEKGYIRRDPSKTRAIDVIHSSDGRVPTDQTLPIPIVGRVAAGEPILAEENIEDYFPVPKEWLNSGQHFILKVKGDSMVNIGIFEGDYLLVEKREAARNREIVVALVDDESATVKRYFLENGTVRLQPENDEYQPIYSKNVKVLGLVKALFRSKIG